MKYNSEQMKKARAVSRATGVGLLEALKAIKDAPDASKAANLVGSSASNAVDETVSGNLIDHRQCLYWSEVEKLVMDKGMKRVDAMQYVTKHQPKLFEEMIEVANS